MVGCGRGTSGLFRCFLPFSSPFPRLVHSFGCTPPPELAAEWKASGASFAGPSSLSTGAASKNVVLVSVFVVRMCIAYADCRTLIAPWHTKKKAYASSGGQQLRDPSLQCNIASTVASVRFATLHPFLLLNVPPLQHSSPLSHVDHLSGWCGCAGMRLFNFAESMLHMLPLLCFFGERQVKGR